MIYEIVATLKMTSKDRDKVLQKIVLMQRHAVRIGFNPEDITIVQVRQSPEEPAMDVTSEVMAAIMVPDEVNPAPEPVVDPVPDPTPAPPDPTPDPVT